MIQKSLSHSGITGLFGQRQVGKTTLLEFFSKEHRTFDHSRELSFATDRPEIFIESRKHPFGIDEAQLCPPLFPALKDKVKNNKKPGLFLLTGSVRFTSRKAIRESLTGRIVGVDVLPLTLSESHERPQPCFLQTIASMPSAQTFEKKIESSGSTERKFKEYLQTGGLPGICFFRDPIVRAQRFEFQIDTILKRDYHLVHASSLPSSSLVALLTYLAIHQGESLNLKEACDYSQISKTTIKRVLQTFEALFLIRELPSHPLSDEVKSAYFLEDQGMSSWLTQNHQHAEHFDLLRGVYANLRAELFYQMGDPKNISFFRTRNGVNVPLVFYYQKTAIGVIPTGYNSPPIKVLAAADSFIKTVPNSIAVIATASDQTRFIRPNVFQIPYWKLV